MNWVELDKIKCQTFVFYLFLYYVTTLLQLQRSNVKFCATCLRMVNSEGILDDSIVAYFNV